MLFSFKRKIVDKNSFFWDWAFFFTLVFLFLKYWGKQLFINYTDYGEGSYLYESFLMNKKFLLYRDFFAPQPPIIYIIGNFILKIFNNPLSIRYLLFILFTLSNIFLFYILKKFFKNKILSFLTISISFLFTNTIHWWPTFTGETFLRFFIIVFLLFFLPIENINKSKILISCFFLNLIFFTKFTAVFFIIFTFLFLLIKEKRLFFSFTKYFIILFLIFFGFFLFIFGKDFLYQTIFIRKMLPIKNSLLSIPSTNFFLIKFLPFYFLNLFFGILFFKKKFFSQSFLFLLTCFWLPTIIFNFFEGTYIYIFYPLEILIPLGFFYFISNIKKIKINEFLRTSMIILSFWIILVLVYQFQIFDDNYLLAINDIDKKNTQKVIQLIQKNTRGDEEIISPPFFAFFSKRFLIKNFHDPFFIHHYLSQKQKYSLFEEAISLLKRKKPRLVVSDWRIKSVLNRIDENYFSSYNKIAVINFLNNDSEILEIYVKKINHY